MRAPLFLGNPRLIDSHYAGGPRSHHGARHGGPRNREREAPRGHEVMGPSFSAPIGRACGCPAGAPERQRKAIYARTRDGAESKLRAAQRALDDGIT